MFCPTCGSAVAQENRFCGTCGAVVAAEGVPSAPGVVTIRRPGVITLLAVLHFILGVLCVVGAIFVFGASVLSANTDDKLFGVVMSIGLFLFGLLQLVVGYGLYALRPWGRIIQIVMSCFGLLGFPMGTLIHGLILYYLFKPGVQVLFSGKVPQNLLPEERLALARLSTDSTSAVIVIAAVCLVIIAFVGILAAIAIPNLLTAMQRSKQKRTMADQRAIATAVESYATDYNKYPEASSMPGLTQFTAPYSAGLPMKDGWGHDLQYKCWDTRQTGSCDSYLIISGGRDGKFDRDQFSDYTAGPTTHFDCDIVYSNGAFVTYPEGVQVQ